MNESEPKWENFWTTGPIKVEHEETRNYATRRVELFLVYKENVHAPFRIRVQVIISNTGNMHCHVGSVMQRVVHKDISFSWHYASGEDDFHSKVRRCFNQMAREFNQRKEDRHDDPFDY